MSRAYSILVFLLMSVTAGAGPGTMFLRASDLRGAVESFVAQLPVREGHEIVVECRDVPDSIPVPSGTLRLIIDQGATPVMRGRVALAVEVVVNGVTVRRVLVAALVRTYAGVLISTRMLGARAPVVADDVRQARVETTEWSRRPVADILSLAGKRTKRIVGEGSVLYEELFEPLPLVTRGDQVTLRAGSKGFSISTGAVALQDGLLGSVITVKASHTRARLRARVIEAGVVSVLEE